MPKPRKSQISLQDTPYYHCVSRCVRRTFLCGKDPFTGQSYEHRKQWVEDRLLFLGSVFAIDICAFAVMSNHTHVVLYADAAQAASWDDEEVLNRWHKLYSGTLLTQRFMRKATRSQMTEAELNTVSQTIDIYRKRLFDISWFMRGLNEFIARAANKEDNCTGRFWEGRFKCQALLDKAALLACMIYVDLNPLRSHLSTTPEDSEHTSIFHRVKAAKQQTQPTVLMPFIGDEREDMPKGLPFALKDYVRLVETTGRLIRDDKPGYIQPDRLPILERLGIDNTNWIKLTTKFEAHFSQAVGAESALRAFQKSTHHKRISGLSAARTLLKKA